jgi:hypothetical protein
MSDERAAERHRHGNDGSQPGRGMPRVQRTVGHSRHDEFHVEQIGVGSAETENMQVNEMYRVADAS